MVARRRGAESVLNRLGWSLLSAIGVNTASLLVGLVLLRAVVSS